MHAQACHRGGPADITHCLESGALQLRPHAQEVQPHMGFLHA